jgi:hypothetical protein
MITFFGGSSPIEALPHLDPVMASEIDDASLYDALTIAGLVDRTVLMTELLQRGLPIQGSIRCSPS